MIGTSFPEYVFIRAAIGAIRLVTPLSILYCGFSIVRPPHSLVRKILLPYAALETAFYFLVYLPRKRYLQRPARHPELISLEERQRLFKRCFRTIADPEQYVRKWFLGAPLEDIKRENVKDFFRWAFLNTGDFDIADNEELELYTDRVEKLLGRKIQPGRGNAQCLRLTVDKVSMMHRPLLWYMIIGLVDTCVAGYLSFHSFHLYRTPLRRFFSAFPVRLFSLLTRHVSPAPDLSYWYRPHTSETRLPVLYIHGIGIGLYPYAKFLAEINDTDKGTASDGQIGVIAVEIMPISARMTGPALPKEEMCRQINAIVESHGWDRFVLASNSYGTVISTHLLHTSEMASKIDSLLLVDPVTFLLHLPDVAYNFTARKPRWANEHQLYYFASKDMMVSHTLARHFFWSENILWKEDVQGKNVTVALGGRDLIVGTETVGRYLVGVNAEEDDGHWKDEAWVGEGLDIIWFERLDHAQAFDHKDARRKLVEVVQQYSKKGQEHLVDVA